MQRAIVTGALGFVGTHLRERLASEGVEAIPLRADVRDAEAVRDEIARAAPDAVFHLAARASVATTWGEERDAWDVNATGTLNVAVGVRDAAPAARLVVVSSGEVYGAVPAERQPIAESEPPRPRSPYGASKAGAEAAAWLAGPQTVVARPFNHIGPGQAETFVVPSFAAQIARAERGEVEPVLRVGNLEARRDFTDVRDVVAAYVLLARGADVAGVYNVASGRARSIREVLDALLRQARIPVAVEVAQDRLRPADIPILSGDPRRLQEATGWRPTRDLDATLCEILEAAREDGQRHA